MKATRGSSGFLLIEVLVALAIFGLCCTMLIKGVFNLMNFAQEFENTLERDQDLQFVRAQVLAIPTYEELKYPESPEVDTLTLGTVNWELDELEPTEVLDVYKVTLRLTWDGGDDFESGEQLLSAYVCRPSWTEGELQEEQNSLKTRKSEKIQELVESQDW